jgi:hypothetical protein
MKVSHLIPYIWVYDFRSDNIEERFLIKYSGTKQDEIHQQNMQEKYEFNTTSVNNTGSLQIGERIYHHYLDLATVVLTTYAKRGEYFLIESEVVFNPERSSQ